MTNHDHDDVFWERLQEAERRDRLETRIRHLEAEIDRLNSPAVVLDAAEKLLRGIGTSRIALSRSSRKPHHCTVERFSEDYYQHPDDWPQQGGDTLAEVYTMLRGVLDG